MSAPAQRPLIPLCNPEWIVLIDSPAGHPRLQGHLQDLSVWRMSETEHFGSCHCGGVQWSFTGPEVLDGIKCNCSVCNKKQNHHCIIKLERFKLLKGEDLLTTYTFNTGVAQHRFCKVCGVQSFYHPRSNPDAVAIMPHCIDGNTVKSIRWTTFDGQEWESTIEEKAPVAQ